MTRTLVVMLVVIATLLAAVPARADVEVRRYGEENPMLTIAKSTVWGGLAGLILGAAVALVAEDNEDDIIKWFFVGGVFVGFGVGVYHVATRPKPTSSLLEIEDGGLALRMPTVHFTPESSAGTNAWRASVTLFSADF